MILNRVKEKRIGIYSFFEKDGIVDRYVEVFLDEYKSVVDKLVIVSNGMLPESEKNKLKKYTNNIIERDNNGFDIWGFREGFLYFGWEELEKYDEVITANNTLMGPVYPFQEMFDEMKERDLDFWGIVRHYELPFDPFGTNEYGYLPEHIQSYFMVYRNSLLKSNEFQQYWDELPELNTYEDAVGRHETSFTKKFSDMGYKWDTYINTEDIKNLNANPIMNYPMLLVKEKRCPIFKRRIFFQDYNIVLDATVGQPAYDLYHYLKNTKIYDVDLIWENIIRTCHQSDFGKNLHLNYIFYSKEIIEEKNVVNGCKIALICGMLNEDNFDNQIEYIHSMPASSDIYFLTNTLKKKIILEEKIKNSNISRAEICITKANTAGQLSLLEDMFDVVKQYEICCFLCDSKSNKKHATGVEESRQYKCNENMLCTPGYVQQILIQFYKEPRLGLLLPPESNHGFYFSNIGHEWHENYRIISKLIKALKFHVPISEKKEPLSTGENAFWFRPKALKKMLNQFVLKKIKVNCRTEVEYDEIPAILRLYAVQSEGYYPAIVMSEAYAANEMDNLRYYVREYNHFIKNSGLMYGTQRDMVRNLEAACQGKKVTGGIPRYMRFANYMRMHLPYGLYSTLINVKRKLFGPYDLVK